MQQDWQPIKLGEKKGGGGGGGGGEGGTEKKFAAGTNKKGTDKNMAKLDAETENFKHTKVAPNVAKNIQAARLAKGMTQAQLAKTINEKPQVINEYESGKAIPNQQILSKIEKALGTKVRGKK
eukprot:CAMPEP_0184710330 /NCGR_PEP_ID=MMETSP0314-20130426/1182_1 /TAXON_ID=38298 /ORGANISM="Rhodella maculata, Strain CCMP 736" /LENGTH=122 /DNA_ID=CAMNT_0027172153 /DNA_START=75 /DNA_END=443 /DNA_ORIENTATION=+